MNFKIQNNHLLILEFDTLQHLRQELNNKLINIDTQGLRATDYKGFNYRIKAIKKFGSKSIKRIIHKYPNIEYVIGYVKEDQETFEHEMLHYRFFRDPSYRLSTIEHFKNPKYSPLLSQLRKMGYRESVLYDEAQAYFFPKNN